MDSNPLLLIFNYNYQVLSKKNGFTCKKIIMNTPFFTFCHSLFLFYCIVISGTCSTRREDEKCIKNFSPKT
jgi:hypothetical protein